MKQFETFDVDQFEEKSGDLWKAILEQREGLETKRTQLESAMQARMQAIEKALAEQANLSADQQAELADQVERTLRDARAARDGERELSRASRFKADMMNKLRDQARAKMESALKDRDEAGGDALQAARSQRAKAEAAAKDAFNRVLKQRRERELAESKRKADQEDEADDEDAAKLSKMYKNLKEQQSEINRRNSDLSELRSEIERLRNEIRKLKEDKNDGRDR